MNNRAQISCEFFPPKTEKGIENLVSAACELEKFNPKYFSITCGALGGDRHNSHKIVDLLLDNTNVPVTPHITCIGSVKSEIRDTLINYKSKGIRDIVALRGDKPQDTSDVVSDFSYANELVTFIKDEFGDDFRIAVAAYPETHPEAKSEQEDFQNFKQKVESGADTAITQFFFDDIAYAKFLENCHKANINIPIVPGVVTIRDWKQILKFSNSCGAHFPNWLIEKFQSFGDDKAAINEFSCDVTTKLCEKLLAAGAEQLHFYSLNHSDLVTRIYENL